MPHSFNERAKIRLQDVMATEKLQEERSLPSDRRASI